MRISLSTATRTRTFAAAATLALVGALGACSTEQEMRGVDESAAGDAGSPAAGDAVPSPVPDGEVRTTGLVTVIDAGEGPKVCLGAVATSSPPQCDGPAAADFAWGEVGAEEAGGVTWGQYALTGTFDGTTFTVTDSVPAALYDVMSEPAADGVEPACVADGATDPSKVSPEDMDATLAAAAALPTYATGWLSKGTISVAVTGDVEAVQAELRKTWGGPLCVVEVERTEADLTQVNTDLQADLGDQLLTSGTTRPDQLDAQVVYDDGSIQDWADATFGDGVVRVTSALEPAS